jgi:hypothetical protein
MEVSDQLRPAIEDVDQRHRPVGSNQRSLRIDFDHRKAASSGRDRVALTSVGLLPHPKPVQFGLERGSVCNCGPGRLGWQLRHGAILLVSLNGSDLYPGENSSLGGAMRTVTERRACAKYP